MPHSLPLTNFYWILNFLYPSFFIYLFFLKDLSHVIVHILRIYVNYIIYISDDSNVFSTFPFFFNLPFMVPLFSIMSFIRLSKSLLFAFHFMIRSLNCSFLSILSLERFASIEFFFWYPNFTILRLIVYIYLRCRWYYLNYSL